MSWINPDDEVGSLLLRSVEKDRQLYGWAAARVSQEFELGRSRKCDFQWLCMSHG